MGIWVFIFPGLKLCTQLTPVTFCFNVLHKAYAGLGAAYRDSLSVVWVMVGGVGVTHGCVQYVRLSKVSKA